MIGWKDTAECGVNLGSIGRRWDPVVDEGVVGEESVDLIGSGFELVG